jgi:hypothetical protein
MKLLEKKSSSRVVILIDEMIQMWGSTVFSLVMKLSYIGLL